MTQYPFNSIGDLSSNKLTFDKSTKLKEEIGKTANEVANKRIREVVDGAPQNLDTLKEIADAISEIGGSGAMSEYYTKEDADAIFLKSSDAESSYQEKGDYALKSEIDDAVNGLLNGVGENYDTLKEIAEALTSDKSAIGTINDALNRKADSGDVYAKTEADEKFVAKEKYDELAEKFNNLFDVVYPMAEGDSATPLNPQYVENRLSNGDTVVEVEKGSLGDVTIPETTKALTVSAPMADNSTVTLSSPKGFSLINTSDEHVDVNIIVPETESSSVPTMNLSGKFNNLNVTNASVGAKSGAEPLLVNNLSLSNTQGKNTTVSGILFGDGSVISLDGNGKLGLSNKNNEDDGNVPSATINAPSSTVTLNKGQWNELSSNVGEDTLVVTQNAHINKLKVIHGNVIVNDRDLSNRVASVENDTEFTVDVRRKNVASKSEFTSSMTGDPCIITLTEDIPDASRITWGIFANGHYKLDLNGHTVRISDTSFGIKTRNAVDLLIVDSVGTGKLINEKSYTLWAGDNTTITVDVPNTTEISGVTHVLYCEGSGQPKINVRGGSFKMVIPEGTEPELDPDGNFKFMLNHYDATYKRVGNCFNITGGKFYGFNPMKSYAEPNGPVNLLGEDYTVSLTNEDGINVYTVTRK